MSIRLRFTITLTLLGVLLFGGYALVSYRGEIDDLHIATEREILALGRSLATSVGNALRDRQRADVDQTLRALEPLEPRIRIHVHDIAGHEIAHTQGATVDDGIEAGVRRAAQAGEQVDFEDKRVVFYAPLRGDDGKPLGAIAVARSLEDLDADLERTRLRLIVVVLAFVFGTLAAGVLLGTIYVSRPLATVLDGIAHVRDGDFKSRIAVPRHDEIGALVDEFNTMVAALGEARTRAEQETEARLRLERGLQGVDKMVTIGQLSAGLAHEIGSPLQVLSGRAQALLEKSTDPEAQRHGHILVEQCERITKIVEQLLSFGRRKPAVIAPCDVDRPVCDVLELLAGEARRRAVDLAFESDDASHRIDADADQLQQVVLNLVKNALAATPKGGRITVRVEGMGELVRLIVRDTGTGIAAEMVPRLFEPFFTTRAQEGGTGLGLAVVRAIAVEHHATVAVESEPGRGAEFVVSFPLRHG